MIRYGEVNKNSLEIRVKYFYGKNLYIAILNYCIGKNIKEIYTREVVVSGRRPMHGIFINFNYDNK